MPKYGHDLSGLHYGKSKVATINLKCRCGAVKGTASDVTSSTGTRVVCCCDACQAFATHLGREADTLDQFGGTDIYQTSQSQFRIHEGQDKLQSLRLTEKGLLRWYTSCCNTPVGNTMSAKMPFVGVIHTFMDLPDRESTLGPVKAYVQTQHAIGTPDYPTQAKKFPLRITLRIISKMLMWKLLGKQKPTVFFTETGAPAVKPIVLRTS